jgi:hypothetical protein
MTMYQLKRPFRIELYERMIIFGEPGRTVEEVIVAYFKHYTAFA